MRQTLPRPFNGSLPGFDGPGISIATKLELAFTGIGIGAAAIVFVIGLQADSVDLPRLLTLSSSLLLLVGLTGMWLLRQFDDVPRAAVSMIYADAFGRPFTAGRPARSPEAATSPFGIVADLLRDLTANVRARHEAGRRAMQAAAAHNQALRAGRDAAAELAGTVADDIETIAELTLDMDSVAARLTDEIGAATRICEVTQDVAGQVASRAADLAGAVVAATGDADRMVSAAVALSEKSFGTQRQIVALVGKTADLASAADQAQQVLHVSGILTLNAGMEAARRGKAEEGFAVLAAEVKVFAAQAGTALETLRAAVGELRHETGLAARRINEVVETVHVQQSVAQSLCHSVARQGAEIGGLLQTLRDAQTGFGTLLASVDAVSQEGVARVRKAHTLRDTAMRLPDHAQQVARLLRDIPDFEPPLDL